MKTITALILALCLAFAAYQVGRYDGMQRGYELGASGDFPLTDAHCSMLDAQYDAGYRDAVAGIEPRNLSYGVTEDKLSSYYQED